MRKILFRAKERGSGKWVQGFIGERYGLNDGFVPVIRTRCDNGTTWFDVDGATIGQFTGIRDKNGKEIYEGDILSAAGSYPLTVAWHHENAQFDAEYRGQKSGHEDDDNDDYCPACEFAEYEIIGNIYDNQELLEG